MKPKKYSLEELDKFINNHPHGGFALEGWMLRISIPKDFINKDSVENLKDFKKLGTEDKDNFSIKFIILEYTPEAKRHVCIVMDKYFKKIMAFDHIHVSSDCTTFIGFGFCHFELSETYIYKINHLGLSDIGSFKNRLHKLPEAECFLYKKQRVQDIEKLELMEDELLDRKRLQYNLNKFNLSGLTSSLIFITIITILYFVADIKIFIFINIIIIFLYYDRKVLERTKRDFVDKDIEDKEKKIQDKKESLYGRFTQNFCNPYNTDFRNAIKSIFNDLSSRPFKEHLDDDETIFILDPLSFKRLSKTRDYPNPILQVEVDFVKGYTFIKLYTCYDQSYEFSIINHWKFTNKEIKKDFFNSRYEI